MAEQALQALDAHLAAGWVLSINGLSPGVYGDNGYYIHRNRVYLAGLVANYRHPGDPPTAPSSTVLTALPAEIRPAVPQTVTLYTDHTLTADPATPGIVTPDAVTASVTISGDLVLDSLPPLINAGTNSSLWHFHDWIAGTGSDPDFPTAIAYALTLSTVTWPLASPLPDTWGGDSMAAFLDGDFDDIDAVIRVHDARVHLGGRLRARVNGAVNITFNLPAAYLTAVQSKAYTLGEITGHASLPVVLAATHGAQRLEADTDTPAPITPPPRYPRASVNKVVYDGDISGALGGYDSLIAGLTTHPHFRGPAGADRQQVVLAPSATATWDNGTYDCPAPPFGPVHCRARGPGPTVTVDITSQLAAYYPPPDWVAVQIAVYDEGVSIALDQTAEFLDYQIGCNVGGGCGPYSGIPCDLNLAASGDCQLLGLPGVNIAAMPVTMPGVLNSGTGTWAVIGGFVQQPGAVMAYTADPDNLGATCLWRPSNVPRVYTLSVVGDSHSGGMGFKAQVVPLWNSRKTWFMAGDVLDLTDAGWHAPAPLLGGVNPGTITAGTGPGGTRRRHRIAGSASTSQGQGTGTALPGAGNSPSDRNALSPTGQAESAADAGPDGWRTTGATWYADPPPGAGNLSAPGYHFAELGTARRTDGGGTGVGWIARLFGLGGELPMGTQLDIKLGDRVVTADKQDRGYGQGGDGVTSDPSFAIDLYDGSGSGLADLPGDLGFKSVGEGDVQLRLHRGGSTSGAGIVHDEAAKPGTLNPG